MLQLRMSARSARLDCPEDHGVGEGGAVDLPGIAARCLEIGTRRPAAPAALTWGLRCELQFGEQDRGSAVELDWVVAAELATPDQDRSPVSGRTDPQDLLAAEARAGPVAS